MNIETSSRGNSDNLPLAVGVIVFTVFALSLGDALVKMNSGTFVLWQIFVLRSVIAIPCLLVAMACVSGISNFLPTAYGWIIIRSFLLVAMWISYYVSLPFLPLSVAAAAYYTLPIFITLFSAAFVGDRVGRLGWLAVLLGFVGVVLILRPDAGAVNLYAVLPLLSAMLYAVAMILTRTKCRSDHPLLLSLGLNVAFVFVGGLATLVLMFFADDTRSSFLLSNWASMGTSEWISIGLMAVALLIGSVGAAIAYQKAPSAKIGVFDFCYVGFALIWGFLFFAEQPDAVSVIGMALIVVAGVLSLRQ